MSPKPEAILQKRQQLKGKPMTIAAGLHCREGVLLFADTNVVLSDGARQQGRKISTDRNQFGYFGVANATEDGNAAQTLVNKIVRDLVKNEPTSYEEVENAIVDRMTTWVNAYSRQKPPDVSLVFASSFFKKPRLYLCQPPATIIEKTPYASAGTGARVTDPMAETIIVHNDVPLRVRLWQIAYLSYCAKKNDAFCGGETHVIFLPTDEIGRYVYTYSMKQAESLGEHMDTYLRSTLWNILSAENDDELQKLQRDATDMMRLNLGVIAKLHFKTGLL
jgi:20S proteasome alpha/beta subunit